MAGSKEWIVVFYVDENGSNPVKEFLQSIDNKTQKTPRHEIEIVMQRLNRYIKREGGDK